MAEVAGVSVGSLYQYHPNKEALVFRLPEREARETWAGFDAIPTRKRLKRKVVVRGADARI